MISKGTSLARIAKIIQKRLISFRKFGHLSHIVSNLLPVVGVSRLQVFAVTLFPTPHQHRKFFDHPFRLVSLQGFLDVVKKL